MATCGLVDSGICGSCRASTEQESIAKRICDEGRISENPRTQQTIENYAERAYGPEIADRIRNLWEQRYGEEIPKTWEQYYDDVLVVHGTVECLTKECDACYEQKAEYVNHDGRIHVCTECARQWTKATGERNWRHRVSKN